MRLEEQFLTCPATGFRDSLSQRHRLVFDVEATGEEKIGVVRWDGQAAVFQGLPDRWTLAEVRALDVPAMEDLAECFEVVCRASTVRPWTFGLVERDVPGMRYGTVSHMLCHPAPSWLAYEARVGWFHPDANPSAPYTPYLTACTSDDPDWSDRIQVRWELRQVGVDDLGGNVASVDWEDTDGWHTLVSQVLTGAETLSAMRELREPEEMARYRAAVRRSPILPGRHRLWRSDALFDPRQF